MDRSQPVIPGVRRSTITQALQRVEMGTWHFSDDNDGLISVVHHPMFLHDPAAVDWLGFQDALRAADLTWRFVFWPGHPMWGEVVAVGRRPTCPPCTHEE